MGGHRRGKVGLNWEQRKKNGFTHSAVPKKCVLAAAAFCFAKKKVLEFWDRSEIQKDGDPEEG